MNDIIIPLDIPDVEVEKMEIKQNGDIIITVRSTAKGTKCYKCGNNIYKNHGYDKEIVLRHLSILGKRTFICIRPARFQCPYCDNNPTTTQKLSWYNPRSPHTKAYEEHVLLCLVSSTVEDVSIKESLGYEAVMGILNRHISQKVDWSKIERLDVLGLDEISLKKGHKDFVTIVSGKIGTKTIILAVLEDRKKLTVKKFLETIPKRLRKKIVAVCSDMYDGFINAAKEILGKKVIVIDRFHVAKLYREGLNKLRKKELKRLKEELSEEAYKKLKGAMWALRKKNKDLSKEELEVLTLLFKYSPLLKLGYNLCNDLTDIFEKDISNIEGKRKINTWVKNVKKSGLDCFDTFISTLTKHIDEITNYFINRHSSGFVEGLNNKIKVIKRRCYGILNKNNLFQRVYLDLEGYALFG